MADRGIGPVTGRAGVAAAITVLVVWGVGFAGIEVPPEVASAFTTLIAFLAGWSVPTEDTLESARKRL